MGREDLTHRQDDISHYRDDLSQTRTELARKHDEMCTLQEEVTAMDLVAVTPRPLLHRHYVLYSALLHRNHALTVLYCLLLHHVLDFVHYCTASYSQLGYQG